MDRTCSECGNSLAGKRPDTLTCSPNCRSLRSRRLSSAKRHEAALDERPAHHREIAQLARNEAPSIARDVLRDELAPIVREHITEEVLRSIGEAVGMVPRMLELIADDMESDNPKTRQAAYTLLARYTLGHPSTMPKEDHDERKLEVYIGLPRPESAAGQALEATVVAEDGVEEMRTCDHCGHDKTRDQFAGESTRCSACFDSIRERAYALYPDDDG